MSTCTSGGGLVALDSKSLKTACVQRAFIQPEGSCTSFSIKHPWTNSTQHICQPGGGMEEPATGINDACLGPKLPPGSKDRGWEQKETCEEERHPRAPTLTPHTHTHMHSHMLTLPHMPVHTCTHTHTHTHPKGRPQVEQHFCSRAPGARLQVAPRYRGSWGAWPGLGEGPADRNNCPFSSF